MPLVILCGYPCCGKSRIARQLSDFFNNESNHTATIVSEPEDQDRNKVFSDSKHEKELRSNLKSQVQRLLSKDNVIILDSGNYIKGYRYELYCLSKSIKTTQCVIHVDVTSEMAWNWNQERDVQYSKEIFDAVIQRFEAPDSRNRWDSPLFTVHYDEVLPFSQISNALFERKAPPPNQSTQSQPLLSTNFLYDLDRLTQETIQGILTAQNMASIGDSIKIPGCQEKILLHRKLTAAELTRLKRQFISYTKLHPVDDVSKLPGLFIQYLNSTS